MVDLAGEEALIPLEVVVLVEALLSNARGKAQIMIGMTNLMARNIERMIKDMILFVAKDIRHIPKAKEGVTMLREEEQIVEAKTGGLAEAVVAD